RRWKARYFMQLRCARSAVNVTYAVLHDDLAGPADAVQDDSDLSVIPEQHRCFVTCPIDADLDVGLRMPAIKHPNRGVAAGEGHVLHLARVVAPPGRQAAQYRSLRAATFLLP